MQTDHASHQHGADRTALRSAGTALSLIRNKILGPHSLLLLLVTLAAVPVVAVLSNGPTCAQIGTWLDPESGKPVPTRQLMASMVERQVVLLGESHIETDQHRWQLYTMAGLHALRSELVVGFEMFPRSVQPALDDWWQGELSESDFLQAARWNEVWGYPADLYLPLLHFMRLQRLPMVALNVERALVSRVAESGWAAIPESDRQGLSDPAPASPAYRDFLAHVYLMKQQLLAPPEPAGADTEASDQEDAAMASLLETEDFARFVEAQLTWDRAMAEALASAARRHPDALVVGIIGHGHLMHGYGVPHQLTDLGIDAVSVLRTVDVETVCHDPGVPAGLADAVFVMNAADPAAATPAGPKLGVAIEDVEGGVRVLDILPGSVAETTELAVGDVIRSAAGFPVQRTSDLIEIIRRQAPGTWLPLEIERDGATLNSIARFPSHLQKPE